MSQTCEAKEDHQAKAKHKANIKHSEKKKKKTKHLGQPGEQGEDKHAPEVPPVTGEVSRVAQTVRSHGEDDEAQKLALIFLLTCHSNRLHLKLQLSMQFSMLEHS